jgi:hypothetical protein
MLSKALKVFTSFGRKSNKKGQQHVDISMFGLKNKLSEIHKHL